MILYCYRNKTPAHKARIKREVAEEARQARINRNRPSWFDELVSCIFPSQEAKLRKKQQKIIEARRNFTMSYDKSKYKKYAQPGKTITYISGLTTPENNVRAIIHYEDTKTKEMTTMEVDPEMEKIKSKEIYY
jgi:hypothetical protein